MAKRPPSTLSAFGARSPEPVVARVVALPLVFPSQVCMPSNSVCQTKIGWPMGFTATLGAVSEARKLETPAMAAPCVAPMGAPSAPSCTYLMEPENAPVDVFHVNQPRVMEALELVLPISVVIWVVVPRLPFQYMI